MNGANGARKRSFKLMIVDDRFMIIGSANLTTMRRDAAVITTSAREAGRYALIQVDMLKQVSAEKDYLLSGDSSQPMDGDAGGLA